MSSHGAPERIVGCSPAILKVLVSAEAVAATDATVLISGETGTGKELVARRIHRHGRRKDRPLFGVNCAALPPALVESELFGHERGAFTGAVSRKIGRFELADGGTLFLDEIGELPLETQPKLLRVLQEGEFERVGGTRTVRVDLRVIAATNRDLDGEIAAGRFREDLFYRLNVFPIRIPSLRERREDIPLLVRHFAAIHGAAHGKRVTAVSDRALGALQAASWPGNVRELAHAVERAVIVCPGDTLELGDWLPVSSRESDSAGRVPTLDELQREHILRVLESVGWKVSGGRGAARILGIKPTTLLSRMKKLGIERNPVAGIDIS